MCIDVQPHPGIVYISISWRWKKREKEKYAVCNDKVESPTTLLP
jgi:hypothetical protein